MNETGRPRILCVDDEPHVLDALKPHLRRRFEVETAPGGEEGLELVKTNGPFAVVMSDMRMPRMNGATFLARVRAGWPDTVRVLLTGASEVDAAIAAVNEGQIFRFLSKPCPAEMVVETLAAAAEQYRLMTAERVLLEQTLLGSVRALTDILAIAHPASFSRATRAKRHMSAVAEHLGITEGRWELEVAAMLSQIGTITLPPEAVDKLYRGEPLTAREQEMVDRHPRVAEGLLADIPRLEGVRAILRAMDLSFSGRGSPEGETCGQDLPLGARLLRIILDYDALEARGLTRDVAFGTLRSREGWYDPSLLATFAAVMGNSGASSQVLEVRLRDLVPGMILAEDVCTLSGGLLIAHGHEVTDGLLERIRNFYHGQGVRQPIRVIAPVGERERGVPLGARR